MSEVTFAKTFLATLDKKPIKLAADHVSDPRKYPNQSPYTLPRQTHPFPRRAAPTSSHQDEKPKTISATVKPMRSGEAVTISDLELDSTIHDIKTQYAAKSGQPQDKIKLLYNKKPAADLKTLKDLGVERDVELSVMIMGGGAPSGTPAMSPAVEKSQATLIPSAGGTKDAVAPTASAPGSEEAGAQAEDKMDTAPDTGSASAMLTTDEFWSDLKGFLTQRLRDEKEAERLAGLFREALAK